MLNKKRRKESEKGSEKNDRNMFSRKGWSLILLCGVMLYFSTGTSVDGLNATVEGLAEGHGWSSAVLLGFSTVSGLISVLGMFIFGLICQHLGARKLAVISLIAGGLSYIWYGHVNSIGQYAVALCMVSVFANVYAWIAGGAYLAAWFPEKKGKALGWAAMGSNLASASIVILITVLTGVLGDIKWAITAIGCVMILLSVWAVFIPDTPQEAGESPDNLTDDGTTQAAKQTPEEPRVQNYGQLLRTRGFWFVSLGVGIYMMVTVGVMSQMIPRLTSIGLSQNIAMGAMSVCALVGTGGSYLWGVLDQKCGTRGAASLYGVWYAAAVVLNMVPSLPCIYLSILMLGIAIGGNAHWPISLVMTVFGARSFTKAYSLINPCVSAIRMLSFSVLALSLAMTGSYTGAYAVFVVLSLMAAFMIYMTNDQKGKNRNH